MKNEIQNKILKTKKNAVIYCRVSTKEQVEEGNSLITQERTCKEYAIKQGYDVTQVFIEEGESAKNADRTQLKRMLGYCSNKKNQIEAVIAYKIDRISRNTDDYSQIRIYLRKYGVEIKSTSEYFEDTPAGRFMENIIANVAQFDNDVRTERSIGGMKEAMREGRYVWQASLGYKNVRYLNKSTIEPDENAHLVEQLFVMASESHSSLEYVRKAITEMGLRNSSGKPVSKSQFYKMLRNEVYTGWIVKFGERHQGQFEPIITEETFLKVQQVLDGKRVVKSKYVVKNPDFPLRQFVRHESGQGLTGAWSQGKSKKYAYYTFRGISKSYQKDFLESKFIEFLNKYAFCENVIDKLFGQIRKNVMAFNRNKTIELNSLRVALHELEKKEIELFEKNDNGTISDEILSKKYAFLKDKIEKTKKALQKLESVEPPYFESLEFSKDMLVNPGETWKNMDHEQKSKFQWFNFPKGVIFDGNEFRTPELSLLYKAIQEAKACFSTKVTQSINNSNHPKITYIPTILNLTNEIKALTEIYNPPDYLDTG